MAVSPDSSEIGFAGLGNIGRPMAAALLRAGWSLTVYDTNADKGGALREAGARVAQDLDGLATCDVLVLLVPDDEAVTAILSGAEGWLAKGGADRSVVVHSTVMPATAAALAEEAAAHGVGFLDAPVSGGADRAERGELTVMVGGDPQVLEQVRPLLDSEADEVILVGPPGAGAATKLANQLMMCAALGGVHEALDLAAAHGVAEEKVLEVVATCTGDSWITRNWGFFDRTSTAYDEGGTPVRARPWSKDLFEVVAAAREADLRVPLAAVLSQTLADRVEQHAADWREDGGAR